MRKNCWHISSLWHRDDLCCSLAAGWDLDQMRSGSDQIWMRSGWDLDQIRSGSDQIRSGWDLDEIWIRSDLDDLWHSERLALEIASKDASSVNTSPRATSVLENFFDSYEDFSMVCFYAYVLLRVHYYLSFDYLFLGSGRSFVDYGFTRVW